MTAPAATAPKSELAQGILWIIGAMFLFTTMDVMAKEVAHRTDTVMAIWARYMGQTVAVTLVVVPRLRQVARTSYPGLQFLRSALLLAATCCFFFGFVTIGMANAAAVMSLNPVLITLGGALILGERLGLRRVLGIAAALVGALIIIRPGSDVFQPAAILPLGAAVFVSGYALATRFVGRDEDVWTSLLYTAAFGAVAVSCVVPFFWTRPDPLAAGLMLVLGSVGAVGHFCLIRAYMAAEASSVAPFSYVGLLFATLYGIIFFAEVPPWTTYLGALVIVAAGIYVWHRETRARRLTQTGPS
ncbi:membrane protein [Candidatus Rhodobacter oscarellae]|uniref:Membrane protein n=1 Tax=Candidatus Rhodobacter oscarellae TaxID=1675527 RepID=A0A0J9E2T0_9RHOB|nr:DMT family transporter [Candidatus Rhodobacter lobularis]KMW57017.1 membrane protein [Candidatus Rhodobacter lobularis]